MVVSVSEGVFEWIERSMQTFTGTNVVEVLSQVGDDSTNDRDAVEALLAGDGVEEDSTADVTTFEQAENRVSVPREVRYGGSIRANCGG